MKICVVSDSHDRAQMLVSAVNEAKAAGAVAVIHCGDIIGAQTLRPLLALGLHVHAVHGNNLGDVIAMTNLDKASGGALSYHGPDADFELGGRRVFVTHFPHYGRAMGNAGNHDMIFCGHSHCASVERVANVRGGQTWVLNPGTVAGLGAPATWMLADLANETFDVRSVTP